MASVDESPIKEEVVELHTENPQLNEPTTEGEVVTEAFMTPNLVCKTESIETTEETVDELLARAERMISESQERIDLHQRSFAIINNLDAHMMDQMVNTTLVNADEMIRFAQQTLDETGIDESILEMTDLQMPTPHVISDGDDDDDVIFVSHQSPQIVDLSQDSPVAVRPITPADNFQPIPTTSARSVSPPPPSIRFNLHQHYLLPSDIDTHAFDSLFDGFVTDSPRTVNIPPATHDPPRPQTRGHNHLRPDPPSSKEDPPKRARSDEPSADKQIRCAVCLEHPFDNRPTSTVCGHVFCHPCIMMALKQYKKCPMCNRKLTAKQVHMLYI